MRPPTAYWSYCGGIDANHCSTEANEWPWNSDQLLSLAQAMAGNPLAESQQIRDTTRGVETDSALIDLAPAAIEVLPANASNITFILVRNLETAPIIRAP